MKRSLLIYIIGIAGLATATAQTADSTLAGRTVEHEATILRLRSAVYDNPAMQQYRYRTSLNELTIGWQHRSASSPVRLEDGRTMNRGFGHIDAYLHKGKGTIYGAASYSNGQASDLQFCESGDYETLAPYVMADTVGGNSHRERYFFKGGFSWPVGRFLIGAEGQYAALMEYRTRDPRPKNLSGDLRVKVGTAYRFQSDYLLGLALTARKYKQTNEVEIYNEVSMPTIYHLTGLGMDYYRFRGDYTETYYKGYGLGALATFGHKDNHGAFARAGYEYTNLDKIISSLNQLPMNTLVRHALDGTIGWNSDGERDIFGLSLTGHYRHSSGTENIFGTAQDNIFPQISEAKQYRLNEWNTALQGAYQHHAAHSGFGATTGFRYSSHDERYDTPLRQMKAGALSYSLALDGHVQTGQWLLTGQAALDYTWKASPSLELPASAITTILAPTLHYYDFLSNNRVQTSVKAEAAYNFQKFMPFVRVQWHYSHYAVSAHQNRIELVAGVRF